MNYFRKQYNEPGTAPGVLEPEDAAVSTVKADLLCYSADQYRFESDLSVEEGLVAPAAGEKRWLSLRGRPSSEFLEGLEKQFQLHRLALEDVMHAGQRSKLEDYDSHLFLVLQRPRWLGRKLAIGQVSLFLGKDFVVSIDDAGDDIFAPVRKRLETSPGGRIRSSQVDYLFYALVDLVVDQAFPLLDGYAQELEELELQVVSSPKQSDLLDRLHESRRELVFLRRALWTQRDAIAALMREDQKLIGKTTRFYLRDCADHAAHVLDLVDSYRDMSVAVMELLISTQNRQLNEAMRVLTMIATIFIPLSFVVGIYGMNFDTEASPWNMPELGWPFGYPAILLLLLAIGVGMLAVFKRKGWF
ncbi:MAG: magnesium/cobalt transporter CorA [Oleiphilaceae bacterium]|nr:magnesium/cobalt transporter CorA [Oleiphilaceae bacterium]